MKIFNIGINNYYHTASIHLKEIPIGLYYLSNFVMWICDKVPDVPFPKFIPWKSPEGWMSMSEWFGDTQQWFHANICTPMFYFSSKHTKSVIIPLPYEYLKELFPDYFSDDSDWDDEDIYYRELTRELSIINTNAFKQLQKKLDYKYVKQVCDNQ